MDVALKVVCWILSQKHADEAELIGTSEIVRTRWSASLLVQKHEPLTEVKIVTELSYTIPESVQAQLFQKVSISLRTQRQRWMK